MKKRIRRVDAELVDSGEPAYYVGPRPWYAKLATWLTYHHGAFNTVALVAVLAAVAPAYFVGWWWVAIGGTGIVCFRLGFLAGKSRLFGSVD